MQVHHVLAGNQSLSRMPAPSVRVVVRLPYNRPENPPPDPPRVRSYLGRDSEMLISTQIEWTSEKADILWKVIERSRSIDGGGADCKRLECLIPPH